MVAPGEQKDSGSILHDEERSWERTNLWPLGAVRFEVPASRRSGRPKNLRLVALPAQKGGV